MLPARRHEITRVQAFSGFAYFLMGPAHWVYGVKASKRRNALEEQTTTVGIAHDAAV